MLRDLSLMAAPGQTILLMGANGSGKSTLLRICAGLLAPDSGKILVGGADGIDNPGLLHRCNHYLGHANGLKTALTVAENIEIWRGLFGLTGDALSSAQAVEAFGLTKLVDTPAHYLSAGQKRRAALARLLLAPRQIWLLDEPLTGLDDTHTAAVETCIANHAAAGGTAIVTTHQKLNLPAAECSVLRLDETRS